MALLSGGVLRPRHPEGNYDERAFLAATVGPLRLPWGATHGRNFDAPNRFQQKISANQSAQVLFVSVALVPGSAVVLVTFGRSDTPSPASDIQHDFSVVPFFQAVLLPDEAIFASVPAITRLMVTEVGF